MHRIASVPYLLGVIAVLVGCSVSEERTYQPGRISTADVSRFVGVLQRLEPGDTSCVGLSAYYDRASPGLSTYRRKFDVTLDDLCGALRRSPERYATLAGKLPALDSAATQIASLFDRFRAI